MNLSREPLEEPSFLSRMLRRPWCPNLLIEFRNMLASHGIEGISMDHIVGLETKYRCLLKNTPALDRERLYGEVLSLYLADRRLSDWERDKLTWLRDVLGLSHEVARRIGEEKVVPVYRAAVTSAISDDRVTDTEAEALEALATAIALPEALAEKIYAETAGARIQSYLDSAIADRQLSPEEDAELTALARNLRVSPRMDGTTQRQLEQYRLFWQIENGEIPEIDPGINLQRGERCYFRCAAAWYELKNITRRLNYGGPTMRIKIMKGLYWRAGTLGVQRISEEVLKHLDDGTVYLTNKRIIFMGNGRNRTIRLNRILDFEIFSNGIQIEKDAGASPFLESTADMELFALLLGRVIREQL